MKKLTQKQKEELARKLRAIVYGKDCSNENWNVQTVKDSWLSVLDEFMKVLDGVE